MNSESHLQVLQVESAGEGQTTPEMRVHLGECAVCRARVARATKFEDVLHGIPRVHAAPDLVPHIRASIAEFAAARRLRQPPYARGLAAAFAAVVALVLVYQAGIELEVGGALTFFAFFVRQPEAVINYPGDALAALVEVLPLLQMLVTLAVVVVAVGLLRRFQEAMNLSAARGSSHHA